MKPTSTGSRTRVRAHHPVAGERLDRLRSAAIRRGDRGASSWVTAFSAPTENSPSRPVSLVAPRIVVCGRRDRVLVVGLSGALRRAADAPRVEQARALAVVAVHVETEVCRSPRRRTAAAPGRTSRRPTRLTTAGSASTWPKSGLTVAVSVRPGVTAYFRSRPTVAPGRGSRERVAGLDGVVSTSADGVGHQLEALRRAPGRRPLSSPNCDTKPGGFARSSGQLETSLRRAPRGPPRSRPVRPPALKRNCENGIRNSAFHPSLGPAARHVPDRVPAVVVVAVVEAVACRAYADRVHREL